MQEKNNQDLLTKKLSCEDIQKINTSIQDTLDFKILDRWFEKTNAFKIRKKLTFRKEMILFLSYLFNQYSFDVLESQFEHNKDFEQNLFVSFMKINPNVCVPEELFYAELHLIRKLPIRQKKTFFTSMITKFRDISKNFFPQEDVFYTENARIERGGQKNMMKYQKNKKLLR